MRLLLHFAAGERLAEVRAAHAFQQEPIDPSSPLLRLDSVVVTPHVAWLTADTLERCVRLGVAKPAGCWPATRSSTGSRELRPPPAQCQGYDARGLRGGPR